MENKPEYKELENPYMVDMIENSLYTGNNTNRSTNANIESHRHSYCCYNFTHGVNYLYNIYTSDIRNNTTPHIYLLSSILLSIILSIVNSLFLNHFMCSYEKTTGCTAMAVFLSILISLLFSQAIIILGSFFVYMTYLTVLKLIECHRKPLF